MIRSERNQLIGGHVTKKTKERLKTYARAEGVTVSLVISRAVEWYLEQVQAKEGSS